MVKKRSTRMQPVHDVASAEEKDLSRELGKAERTLDEQVSRLQELRSHREEYAAKSRQSEALGSPQWRDYRLFLDRLNQAIVMQEGIIADWRRRRDDLRRQWQVKRQRLESLDRIIDRYRRSELVEEERREQRAADAQARPRTVFGDD
jgi:flagellar FliJ protein